jgi:hypothetical protein
MWSRVCSNSERFDPAPVSASVVLLIAAFLIFFFYYVLQHAEELQLRSGEVTSFLQGHFSNDRSDMLSMLFHEILGTPFWVLLVSLILWSAEYSGSRISRIGAHCYFITTVSFVVKSLVKNFLQVGVSSSSSLPQRCSQCFIFFFSSGSSRLLAVF